MSAIIFDFPLSYVLAELSGPKSLRYRKVKAETPRPLSLEQTSVPSAA